MSLGMYAYLYRTYCVYLKFSLEFVVSRHDISTSHETKWLAGLSLSKRAREVEANKKLAQGIRQFEKAMIVTS